MRASLGSTRPSTVFLGGAFVLVLALWVLVRPDPAAGVRATPVVPMTAPTPSARAPASPSPSPSPSARPTTSGSPTPTGTASPTPSGTGSPTPLPTVPLPAVSPSH
ncbi:MAG: hypothetical protein JWO22_2388 [Frankiales bacterium]|nr:hypothetical protein [Frankiales bacterium]